LWRSLNVTRDSSQILLKLALVYHELHGEVEAVAPNCECFRDAREQISATPSTIRAIDCVVDHQPNTDLLRRRSPCAALKFKRNRRFQKHSITRPEGGACHTWFELAQIQSLDGDIGDDAPAICAIKSDQSRDGAEQEEQDEGGEKLNNNTCGPMTAPLRSNAPSAACLHTPLSIRALLRRRSISRRFVLEHGASVQKRFTTIISIPWKNDAV
jgi:hypothetical protein